MKKKVMKKIIHQMVPKEYRWVNQILVRLTEIVGEEMLKIFFRRMRLMNSKNRKGGMRDAGYKRDN